MTQILKKMLYVVEVDSENKYNIAFDSIILKNKSAKGINANESCTWDV